MKAKKKRRVIEKRKETRKKREENRVKGETNAKKRDERTYPKRNCSSNGSSF